jgi:hypothetical protein
MTKAEIEQEKADLKALEDAAFDRGRIEGLKNGETTMDRKVAEAKAAGAEQERERIRAVEANAHPGHEKLVTELKFDGKTTGPEAAQKILDAEKAGRQSRLDQIRAEAPKPAPASPPPAAPKDATGYKPAEVALKARRYQAEMAAKGVRVSTTEATNHVLEAEGFKVGTEPVGPPAA